MTSLRRPLVMCAIHTVERDPSKNTCVTTLRGWHTNNGDLPSVWKTLRKRGEQTSRSHSHSLVGGPEIIFFKCYNNILCSIIIKRSIFLTGGKTCTIEYKWTVNMMAGWLIFENFILYVFISLYNSAMLCAYTNTTAFRSKIRVELMLYWAAIIVMTMTKWLRALTHLWVNKWQWHVSNIDRTPPFCNPLASKKAKICKVEK